MLPSWEGNLNSKVDDEFSSNTFKVFFTDIYHQQDKILWLKLRLKT